MYFLLAMCTYVYTTVHMWKSEDHLWDLVPSFHHVGPAGTFTSWAILQVHWYKTFSTAEFRNFSYILKVVQP